MVTGRGRKPVCDSPSIGRSNDTKVGKLFLKICPRLRPRHFDRGLLALFHFVLVVLIKPLGQPQCFALHLDVFIQAHQVGIEPGYAGHRVDHLLAKHQVGDPLVILGDANESPIQANSEAAQQRLGNCKSKA
jgi:hypothetical protein